MGHERVGSLPRTARWRNIVADIAGLESGGDATISDIAERTLTNIRTRYNGIYKDSGVHAAFVYLLSLATYRHNRPEARHAVGIDLDENPSYFRIAAQLNAWVSSHIGSSEYGEIARRAGGDAIVRWTQRMSKQDDLFDDPARAQRVWDAASDAEGFCEIARIFFAKFTERYLLYFLEREASAESHSLDSREQFSDQLSIHVDKISRHAYETSKIGQSFAAGWFNNHARYNHPSDKEVEQFLSLSFGKLQEELYREASL